VVSGSRDNSVRAWDLRTGRPRLHLTQHFGGVQCLAFDDKLDGANGGYLSGARDSTINVWARSGHFLRTLRSHKGLVNAMAVRQNEGKNGESRVASGSSDGCLRIWDHHSSRCVRTLQAHHQAVTSVVWGPGPSSVITGSTDCSVKLWNTRTGQQVRSWDGHAGTVTQVLADGGRAYSSSRDGTVRIWGVPAATGAAGAADATAESGA